MAAFSLPHSLHLKNNERIIRLDYDDSTILERRFHLPKTKHDNLYSTELKYCTKYNLLSENSKDYFMFKPKDDGCTITISKDSIVLTSVYKFNGGEIKIP